MFIVTSFNGRAAEFTSLANVKAALFLIGVDNVDMRKVENDLKENRYWSQIVGETDEEFLEVSVQYG